MNQDLQNLLDMIGGNANQGMGYSSGQQYAQSIAGGQNVPGMIAPGVSYSMERPEGYTQSRFYNAGPVPVMPSAPTQGNPLTIDNQMPYAPPGVTTPERYTPMITNAESLKNLSDLFNANLPNNMGVSFDPFIDGEPMAIDDLQPTLFDIPFTPPANNLPSTGSSAIDFSFNPFTPNQNVDIPVDIPVDTTPNAVLEPYFDPNFVRPNAPASTGFLNVINPDATGLSMYTDSPKRQQALQGQYDEYLSLFDKLQQRSRVQYRLSPEGREKQKQEEARFKELYNMFGVIGTGGAYTPMEIESDGSTIRSPENFQQMMANDVYSKYAIDQPAPTPSAPSEPQTTMQVWNQETGTFDEVPIPDFPSNPLNTPSTPEGEESPDQTPYAPTPGSTPYAPTEIDPIPQPVDVPVDPMPPYFVPETPVVSLQDLPTTPIGMPFIPNEPMPSVSMQDYNDQLIKEILDPTPVSSPIQNFGGYNNVRSFLR